MKELSEKSRELLKNCLEKYNPSLLWTLEREHEKKITVEIYNDLRDIVCDELILYGFNKDGSISEYGNMLETLIDEIGDLFM